MYAKTSQVGVERLEVPQINEKIGGRKVKNNGIEVIE